MNRLGELRFQGDVGVEEVFEMPKASREKSVDVRNGRYMIAYGEATGHHHSVAVADVEAAIVDDNGVAFLKMARDCYFFHNKHAQIPLKGGAIYRFPLQTEYRDKEIQRVSD